MSLSVVGDVLELIVEGVSSKVKIPKGDRGVAGRDGISVKGDTGDKGEQGQAGRDSCVAGVKGDTGDKGECGSRGVCPEISIGSVVVGESPVVIVSGAVEKPVFHFVVPRGEKGVQGVAGVDGKHGSSEYVDILYLGNSPRYTDEWCGKHLIADGIMELPEMTDNDCGKWVCVKTFLNVCVAGLVEDGLHLKKGESAKFVVIHYCGKFKFTKF